MKRFFPALIFVAALLWVASSWLPQKTASSDMDLASFGKIPVLVGGRIKPLDTVSRNSLLIIHGKETVRSADEKSINGMRWLADVFFHAHVADEYPVFVIQNAEVLGLFGWEQRDRKYFSFAELSPFLKQIDEQGEQSDKLQSVQRSAYQNEIVNLRNALVLYQRLKNSLQPEGAENFAAELESFENASPAAAKAARQRENGGNFDQAQLDAVAQLISQYQKLAEDAYVLAVPPPQPKGEWHSIGENLVQSIGAGKIATVAKMYAQIGDAYRANDASLFGQRVDLLAGVLAKEQASATKRASFEFLFNQVDPFTHSMVLYVLAFLLACGSWLGWSRPLSRAAFYLLLLALAIHTFGLVSDHRASSRGQRRYTRNVASRARHQHLAGYPRRGDHHRLFRHVSRRNAGDHLHRPRRFHPFAEKGNSRQPHAHDLRRGLFCHTFQFRRHRAWRHLGRSIVGTILGLGSKGKWCGADCALVRDHFARALGWIYSPARAHDHGDFW
jgi:hypothetical protein